MTRLLAALLVLALVSPLAHAEGLRRFAIVAGANDGGGDRVHLRYAASDAHTFAAVLTELGGVDAGDVLVLAEPDPAELEGALAEMAGRLVAAKRSGRTELFFYYSGHSDERGLLLGGERLPYRRLRQAIDKVPADVRIAVLDSCASGALTREKGGVRRAAFQVDASQRVEGTAFLTSASADEPAQESDRLGASFFTHHLVSGLRGAADLSGDGRVTLNEAYQYAFQQTLAQTEATQAGAQHPNYDMRLVGSGDLVITDLRSTAAVLVVPPDLDGRLFVRDAAGRLAAEVDKLHGTPVRLGLQPGSYTITVDQRGRALRGQVVLAAHAQTPLRVADLREVELEQTASRGEPTYREYAFNLSVVPGLAVSGFDSTDVSQTVALNLLGGYAARLRGVEVSGGFNWEIDAADGLQVAAGFNTVGGPVRGAQLAGGVNVATGEVLGLQLASGVNLAGERLAGGQVSGGVNLVTGPLVGAQLGPVNIAEEATGAQLGVVNVTTGRVRGLQLGVVNYADDVDAPIGLLSIVKNGAVHADVWASDAVPAAVALRLGSKYVHNLFAFGTNPLGDDVKWMLGLGLGGHVPLHGEAWFLDADVLSWHISRGDRFTTDLDLLTQLRVSAGHRLTERFAVFAGASLNVLSSRVSDGADWRLGSVYETTVDDVSIVVWPGFFAGIRI